MKLRISKRSYKCIRNHIQRLAILTFIKQESSIVIHLQIDNKSAISYFSKTRGNQNQIPASAFGTIYIKNKT